MLVMAEFFGSIVSHSGLLRANSDNPHTPMIILIFLLVWSPWPDILLIIGWFFQAQSSGYPVTRLCPLLVSVLLFPVHWWFWSPLLSPLRDSPRDRCLQPICSRVYLSLLLFPPLCLFVFIRRQPVWLTRWRPVSVPSSRRLLACLPDLYDWWYVARVWVEGQRRRRPPAMALSSLTRQQASSGVWVFLGLRTMEGMSEYGGMC